jgi:hypothetical protein
MRRLEYVCTACGRPFGRLESARRHVFNPNIHNRQGATITSLTEYALGIKQGRYLPPSYNVPRILGGGKRSLLQQPQPSSGNQRGETTKGTETMFDSMHKYANFARDFKDFNEIMKEWATKAAENSRRNPLPEFLIGYACDRCYTTELRPILSFLDPTTTLHQCDPAKARKLESVENREETFKDVRKSFAGTIKLQVDTWTKNSGKYLIAQAISPEFAQQAPLCLNRWKVTLQAAGSDNYLNRAVTSAKKDGSWIAINDNETLDFLEKTLASVAIFEVKIDGNNDDDDNSKNEEDPASTHEYFLVRIVPPQYVEAKKQNDEFATIMKEFLKEDDCKDLQ